MTGAVPAAGPVLVVGASLAGATAAVTLRESGCTASITLLGAEDALPYERPALSKTYLAGQVSADALLVHPAKVYADRQITMRLGESAVGLDVDRRIVRLASGEELPFATLVIATGASNVRPSVPGLGLTGVHQLRTLADADLLRAALPQARAAVIIGMGFIGCEIAATLVGLGLQVTAVDGGPGPLWAALGPELSALVRGWHERHGVRVLTEQNVTALLPGPGDGRVAAVELSGGERLAAELVIVGVGVRPNTSWLAGSALHLAAGAVAVDVDGRTNAPGIFAVGDVCATWDDTAGTHRRHEHWSSAIVQARRAAWQIADMPGGPSDPPYFWSDQYDKTLQYSGEHSAGSQLVVRGDLATPDQPMTSFLLRDAAISAVLSVNDGKQFRRAQHLLGTVHDPAQLADPTVDLRHLAQPAPVRVR